MGCTRAGMSVLPDGSSTGPRSRSSATARSGAASPRSSLTPSTPPGDLDHRYRRRPERSRRSAPRPKTSPHLPTSATVMHMRDRITPMHDVDHDQLYSTAESQAGYFTAGQRYLSSQVRQVDGQVFCSSGAGWLIQD